MSRPSMRYRNGEGPTLVFKDLLARLDQSPFA